MSYDTVKGIEGYIKRKDSVKDSYAMYVMVKISATLSMKNLADITLTCVAKRSVTNIVAKCY